MEAIKYPMAVPPTWYQESLLPGIFTVQLETGTYFPVGALGTATTEWKQSSIPRRPQQSMNIIIIITVALY
jgi:hypothetical protein